MILILLAVFLLPLLARAAQFAISDAPRSWHDADWSSTGLLPPADRHPQARLIVFSSHAGRWKGVVSVHSWIVYKRADDRTWTRHDVVGWGRPVRTNGWAPDGRWYGNKPVVLADLRGAAAEALLPKVDAAVRSYAFREYGAYRVWPGPNSNTFVAAVLRAVPELGVMLPSNAVGRDFRPQAYFGLTDSGTGIEANLWGLFGVKLGWVEGVEVNLLGLVAGLDLRHPAAKLPGYGHLGIAAQTAVATPAGD
jgi:hypothetical protein